MRRTLPAEVAEGVVYVDGGRVKQSGILSPLQSPAKSITVTKKGEKNDDLGSCHAGRG